MLGFGLRPFRDVLHSEPRCRMNNKRAILQEIFNFAAECFVASVLSWRSLPMPNFLSCTPSVYLLMWWSQWRRRILGLTSVPVPRMVENLRTNCYSERNQFKLTDYHMLTEDCISLILFQISFAILVAQFVRKTMLVQMVHMNKWCRLQHNVFEESIHFKMEEVEITPPPEQSESQSEWTPPIFS